ncbi:MAG: glycosyltransferase [Thermodesulfobacteriota bacterium]
MRTKGPLVSVLMPFRNAASTVEEALDSICNQTLDDFELLAVDDGSQDHSARLVERMAQADPRIRLLKPGRLGLVRALNLGIQEAKSDTIARMDADDLMHPQRLEIQWAYLIGHPETALVASQVEMFPEEAISDGYREYLRWQNRCLEDEQIKANVYVESPFVHPSVMVRKRALEEVGGYREGDFPEDYELWLRMCHAGAHMAKVPMVLLRWREHPDRASRRDPRYSREAFDRLRADYLSREKRLRGGRDVVFWGAGRRSRQRAKLLMDKGIRPSAWIDIDPEKIGKKIWEIPVYGPQWLDREAKPVVLIYVRTHGAREQIQETLESMGYSIGLDFLPVG